MLGCIWIIEENGNYYLGFRVVGGLYMGYFGIVEKKMETIGIGYIGVNMGIYGGDIGLYVDNGTENYENRYLGLLGGFCALDYIGILETKWKLLFRV